MKKNNAADILRTVESYITDMENGMVTRYKISDVYDDLSIFDWWPEYLSKTKLYDMRSFLKEAIKLGYTGYVCFKVGATGCANGMWAHKEETTTGYSPDGECLYKSFTPAYNYWQVKDSKGNWLPSEDDNYDSIKTIKQLEELMASLNDSKVTTVNDLLAICGSATCFTVTADKPLDEDGKYLGSFGLFEELAAKFGECEVISIWPATKDVLEIAIKQR